VLLILEICFYVKNSTCDCSAEQVLLVDLLTLIFQVLFNLANQYAANEMYNEALNTYQVIVKNKMFSNAGMFLFVRLLAEVFKK
jgi:hypothetical protein